MVMDRFLSSHFRVSVTALCGVLPILTLRYVTLRDVGRGLQPVCYRAVALFLHVGLIWPLTPCADVLHCSFSFCVNYQSYLRLMLMDVTTRRSGV
jgi:hypothetical protein